MTSSRSVFITGASRGIGKALAFEFARRGYRVALCAKDLTELEKHALLITSNGGKAIAMGCDVRSEDQMRAAVQTARDAFGSIDIAILNAGIGHTMRFTEYDQHIVDDIFATNVIGAIRGLAILTEVMKVQGHGIIAGVSSLADKRSIPGSSVYFASKAALTILLEAAAIELRPLNIDVITIRPGFVATDMTASNVTPMPFLMSAEKAAKIIVDGIERKKHHIGFPFASVIGSAMLHLVPRWLFRWLLKGR